MFYLVHGSMCWLWRSVWASLTVLTHISVINCRVAGVDNLDGFPHRNGDWQAVGWSLID